MPKFQVTAYEEVYYEGIVEAEDQDDAEAIFALSLGEVSPLAKSYEYQTTQILNIEESNNA
jgi:hypothetical protein